MTTTWKQLDPTTKALLILFPIFLAYAHHTSQQPENWSLTHEPATITGIALAWRITKEFER